MTRLRRTRVIALALGFLVSGFLALALGPGTAGAQSVLVEVRTQDTGEPIRGAFATLLDASGAAVRSALTNATGRYLFVIAEPGTYRIRVEMMGKATHISYPLLLEADHNLVHRVGLSTKAVTVEGFEISGERVCRVRPFAATATASIWEEARKALEVTAWGEDQGETRYHLERFTRRLNLTDQAVETESRASVNNAEALPFRSRSAAELAADGFVLDEPEADTYFAPDAYALLSDDFLDTHCMSLIPSDLGRPGSVGVTFEPTPGRDVADIRGTFWVDVETGRLQSLDFIYTHPDPSLDDDRFGGQVIYERLPDGLWIVRSWRIRMPLVGAQTDDPQAEGRLLVGLLEEGGEVRSVRDLNGNLILESRRGSIDGVLLDQDSGQPLPSTEVWIEGVNRATTTDETGRFSFPDIPEGRYQLLAASEQANGLGLLPDPQIVSVRPAERSSVEMMVPSLHSIVRDACSKALGTNSALMVVGRVSDAETGRPIPDARVQVWWNANEAPGELDSPGPTDPLSELHQWLTTLDQRRRGVETWSDESGSFATCGPQSGSPLAIHAENGFYSSDTTNILPVNGELLFDSDLAIRTTGVGTLTGLIVDFATGTALPSARITLEGSPEVRTSGPEGIFSFEDLPVGGYLMTVELLGYATLRDTVVVGQDQNIQVQVQLPSAAFELDPLIVEVMRGTLSGVLRPAQSISRFAGLGTAEIRPRFTDLTGVLRERMAGQIRIDSGGGGTHTLADYCVQATRRTTAPTQGCASVMLIVDGIPLHTPPADDGVRLPPSGAFYWVLSMPPEQIESVRVLSPSEGRFRYGPQGRFGVLVITTRRGG